MEASPPGARVADRTPVRPLLGQPTPQQILRWAIETFYPELVVTSAFGLNGVALLHMLHSIGQPPVGTGGQQVPVLFVDTGYLFEETLETKRRIEAAYGVQVLTYHPIGSLEVQACQIGPDLAMHWPTLCCAVRKVEPMRRALEELQPRAVLNGRARFQASTRRNLPVVEWDQAPIRINPLAFWSQRQVKEYVRVHKVPYNRLYDQGYPSVGCWPCTKPVAEGEDLRAGRWAGLGKTECGLWTLSEAGQAEAGVLAGGRPITK